MLSKPHDSNRTVERSHHGMMSDAMRPRVGQPAITETVQVNGEPVVVDLEVFWADRKQDKLRVCGTASGSSTWMMERLEESFIIEPSGSV
jgi:hypothetical protein